MNKCFETVTWRAIFAPRAIPYENVNQVTGDHFRVWSEEGSIVYDVVNPKRRWAVCTCSAARSCIICKHQVKVLLVLGMEEPGVLHSVLHYGSNDATRQPAMAHISDETFKFEVVRDNMAATTLRQGARDIREKSKVEKLLPQWEGLW